MDLLGQSAHKAAYFKRETDPKGAYYTICMYAPKLTWILIENGNKMKARLKNYRPHAVEKLSPPRLVLNMY